LVLDTFKAHLKDDVLANLEENNISHVLIPGGCTSKIQPLDVCLNKPFKAYIRGAWEEYMVGQAQSTHTASQIPTASMNDVLGWVVAANQCLNSQTDMVKKSFLVCGISNSLDGSENQLVRVPAELPMLIIPYGAEKTEDKSELDPFATSEENTDEEECDGEDSE